MNALSLLIPALLAVQDETGPRVELRGIMVVEGISFKQGDKTKYTGDTYLLKLAFSDAKGEAMQPTPTMNFLVYNGAEPFKKVQRLMTKEQWKADTEKIGPKSVADNTIAFDKKAGELWVGVVRADSGFDLRFDLTLEIRGVGTWIWKGVDKDKEYKAPARGADKPAEKK